jgi:HSP20 family molecular chaperone IbpA
MNQDQTRNHHKVTDKSSRCANKVTSSDRLSQTWTQLKPHKTPKARLYQKGERWILQVALPGVSMEEVTVKEKGRQLKILANTEQYTYERTFSLPNNEIFSEVDATLNLGILTLSVTSAAPNIKQIEIRSVS